jgi:type III pantothenate kinase
MIFAAIDIGNTNIKTGIFQDDVFKSFNFFNDETAAKSYLKSVGAIKTAAVSSVVPILTDSFSSFFIDEFGFAPYVITKDSRFNLTINYETPGTLGIDRICSCEGAVYLLKQKNEAFKPDRYTVTSDLGTATTINIVKNGNEFIGGIIAPGLFTMASSLYKNTAQLPQIEFGDYKELIGKNTIKAIESGIINSTLGLYNITFEHLKQELGAGETDFYVTGGNARHIIPHLKCRFTFVEELVIYGIKNIYNLNRHD